MQHARHCQVLGVVVLAAAICAVFVACSDGAPASTVATPTRSRATATTTTTITVADDDLFPDVVAAAARQSDDGTWTFEVTISSPYDSADRYADAWRVLGPDGAQLGIRELSHDHAGEQPFTRSLDGVEIPDGTAEVTIQGRDQRNGWGGKTQTVALPR